MPLQPGVDLLTLDEAWERLCTHVEWSEGFWLVFVFTNDHRVVEQLHARLLAHLEQPEPKPRVRHRLLRCPTPEPAISRIAAQLLEEDPVDLSWIDLVRFDDSQGKPGWGEAWAGLLHRLNERRELLRRRTPRGGIVFATTLDRLDASPSYAPDLWTIRSLVLPVEGLPRDSALSPSPGPPRTREPRSPSRNVELARQALRAASQRGDQGELASALSKLADTVTEEEAVPIRREAIEHLRRIVAADPAPEHRRRLAHALNKLGVDLSTLGRRELALDATREYLSITRGLAKEDPEAFLPDLAASLNNLGVALNALGEREAALHATCEAIDIDRKLAKARPKAFLPGLAASLNNLGADLSALGEREAALHATSEAIDIQRELAKARPDAFLPDLASSLMNLGTDLNALGEREGALDATREAVDIRRELAMARPDAFLPDLASSLNNLGIDLNALGEREAALDATREAVDVQRGLAKARPDAILPDLANSLRTRAKAHEALDDPTASDADFRESLRILEPFCTRLPQVFTAIAAATAREWAQLREAAGLPMPEELRGFVEGVLAEDES